ncbi:hypothetical protein THAOC_00653 [Thalassiosira oceanica]|uniref:Uncharacterized protein n=1 Tax=Thalassiosira oceanica TaxID=159749 RepID=K0TJW8_THAOC|nr:hypothetical protein THAOC_00653 [Thalassiosira oceanica]|eukprot:EJK77514.1 hypothetical protein THAOC_00653 [Thalassiosira oceanica]
MTDIKSNQERAAQRSTLARRSRKTHKNNNVHLPKRAGSAIASGVEDVLEAAGRGRQRPESSSKYQTTLLPAPKTGHSIRHSVLRGHPSPPHETAGSFAIRGRTADIRSLKGKADREERANRRKGGTASKGGRGKDQNETPRAELPVGLGPSRSARTETDEEDPGCPFGGIQRALGLVGGEAEEGENTARPNKTPRYFILAPSSDVRGEGEGKSPPETEV